VEKLAIEKLNWCR